MLEMVEKLLEMTVIIIFKMHPNWSKSLAGFRVLGRPIKSHSQKSNL